MFIAKVGDKCDTSFFTTHPTLLMVPIFQQGDLDSGFTFFNAGGLRHVYRHGGFPRYGYAAFVSIITKILTHPCLNLVNFELEEYYRQNLV